MLYIDSSSLLKTLWQEPESDAVRKQIAGEFGVVISALAELETEVQLRGKWMSGAVSKRRYEQQRSLLASFRNLDPFQFRDLSGSIFQRALRQHCATNSIYCRTLDRLHLAAMAELGLHRLLTHDHKLAIAARSLGYETLQPGQE